MLKSLKNLLRMQANVQAPSKVKYDTTRKMMALQYNGKRSVKIGEECPVPIVTDPTDAIVKITAATICGSDLHFYNREIPGMNKGYIMGHESIGIVDDVGPEVKHIKKGERVVVSAVLGCGKCEYCQRQQWSLCDITNQNPILDEVYGHHIGGFIGYSHTFGGYDGVQAEYVRVPFADFNLFPIPANVTDKQALPIADALSTSYHGTELADIQKGDKIAIFGCGPIGLLTMMWSKYRGASKIVAIDVDAQRLEFAKKHYGVDTVNSSEEDPCDAVFKLIPGGPDKVIECAGFRFPEKLLDKIQFKLKLESDAPNIINHAIKMVKKGGRITIIGDYGGYANHLWIGGIMMKHLTVNGGCVWPQKYQKMIFELLAAGKIDPTVVFTHTFPLSKGDEAYRVFNDHEDGCIKTFIVPDSLYNANDSSK